MKRTKPHRLPLPSQQIRYVFLDRDGVFNRKAPEGDYVSQWSEFQLLPGVEEAIATLNRSNRRVIVISNQRGDSLGLYTSETVEMLHDTLQLHLARCGARIDAFYFCPHDQNQCECRKPGPGLFLRTFHDLRGASPLNSLVIGDSLSDIQAANNLEIPAIFIQGDPRVQKPYAAKAAALADAV